MSNRVRLLLLAFAATAALAYAGAALAAFTPTMSVSANPARAASAGLTAIRVTVPREDEALAKISILVPVGYTATFGQAAGTQLGSVTAQVQVREPVAGAVLPVTGTIQVADPAAVSASVTQCTGTATHSALWVLVLAAAGTELRVPVAVDTATAPFSAFASHVLQICLPNPNIPTASGGATFGAKLINAQLNVRNVFSTPVTAGDYTWRAVATPWPNGAGAPVAANTREARAHIKLPVTTGITVTTAKRKVRGLRTVTVSGTVREGGAPMEGASVRITVGRTAKTVRVSANARFTASFRLRRGRYAAALRITTPERTAAAACATPGPFQAGATPVPCATETLPFYEAAPSGAPAGDNTLLVAARAFRVR